MQLKVSLLRSLQNITTMVTRSPSPSLSDRPAKKARSDIPPVENTPLTLEHEVELVEKEMALPIEFDKTYETEIDYRNKLVLAPMVRTGSCEFSVMDLAEFSALCE
jgi:hypothetical protein